MKKEGVEVREEWETEAAEDRASKEGRNMKEKGDRDGQTEKKVRESN